MIRSLANVDAGAALRLWNRFHPAKYRIDAETFHDHTVGCPTFDWGASLAVEEEGEIVAMAVVKRSPSILYRGPDRDTAHLAAFAFDDAVRAVDLLADVKRILRNRGVVCLLFGGDNGHFFPAVPTECPRLADFLKVQGFDHGPDAIDLERDLVDYEPPVPLPTGATFRNLKPGERGALDEFLEREFPGRWRYDVLRMVDRGAISQAVHGVFADGELHGFALLQDKSTPRPVGGAVWRMDLGDDWGSLGPIGVSKSVRGRGFGDGVLASGLLELKSRGCRHTIIDWTTLVNFYGKHGLAPTRTYRRTSQSLDGSLGKLASRCTDSELLWAEQESAIA